MKKVLLFSFLFFTNILFLNAECSYKDLRELNTLASYIETHYDYNESTGKFDLTILNMPREFFVTYDRKTFNSNGEEIVINDFVPGSQFKGTVISSSGTTCGGENLRTITVNIPYLNPYYGDNRCIGHENLDVCSNRFLDYEISYKTFYSLLKSDTDAKNKVDKEEDKKDDTINSEKNILEKTVDVLKEIYIPLILVILTSLITFGVCNVIYRKMKHGL